MNKNKGNRVLTRLFLDGDLPIGNLHPGEKWATGVVSVVLPLWGEGGCGAAPGRWHYPQHLALAQRLMENLRQFWCSLFKKVVKNLGKGPGEKHKRN